MSGNHIRPWRPYGLPSQPFVDVRQLRGRELRTETTVPKLSEARAEQSRRRRDLTPGKAFPNRPLVPSPELYICAKKLSENMMVGEEVGREPLPRLRQESAYVVARSEKLLSKRSTVAVVCLFELFRDANDIHAAAGSLRRAGSEIFRNETSAHESLLVDLDHDVEDRARQGNGSVVRLVADLGHTYAIEGNSDFTTFGQFANAI